MPFYNFMARFETAVETGQKLCTIREQRKRPTRRGDTLYLYTGLRTKRARLLRTAVCARVRPILITEDMVMLDGRILSDDDLDELVHMAGFEDVEEFRAYMTTRYGVPTFRLELIEWDVPHMEVG